MALVDDRGDQRQRCAQRKATRLGGEADNQLSVLMIG
jgi:hypothetical protein